MDAAAACAARPAYAGAPVAATLLLVLALATLLVPRAEALVGPPGDVDGRQALVRVSIADETGSYAERAHVTFSAPFAEGALTDLDELVLWPAQGGDELPRQARALSRWPSGSVRWAQIDTQVEVQARQSKALLVGRRAGAAPDPVPWSLTGPDDNGAFHLDDGRTRWPLLRSNGLRGDEFAGLRARLVDGFDIEYRAEIDAPDDWLQQGPGIALQQAGPVEIVEWGPLRVVARVRGAHRPRPGTEGALPVDFHSFTAYAHFLAGQAEAHVEWSLENGPLHDPPGALAFTSYELSFDVGLAPRGIDVAGSPTRGDAPFALHQDGLALEQQEHRVDGRALRTPRAGDLWAGVLSDTTGGVYVHVIDSAENHPTALTYEPGSPLVAAVLPAGSRPHWLDDATRKTFRLTLARGVGREGRSIMRAAVHGHHATIDPRDVASSGAWGDTGLFYMPGPGAVEGLINPLAGAPTGWADYGERVRNTHQSGSPRNRLSVYLEAIQSRRAGLFEAATARAWHAMDLRPFHILGFSADAFPGANLYEGTPHDNEPPDRRLGRSEMGGLYPEWKQGLPPNGHGYNGFDGEHMTLDDIYECYLLTGSWPALGALRSAGEAMLTWHWVKDYLHTARTTGWTLRALVQVARATGDRRYLEAAAGMVTMVEAERGHGEVKYMHRNRPDSRHIADAESESPWMVAVAVHGLAAYGLETGDERIPPLLSDLSTLLLGAYRGNGFASDIPADGPLDAGDVWQPLGLSQWVPGAIAVAAHVTGDETGIDVIRPYFEQMLQHSSGPVSFGSSTWHWWQPYLALLERRR